METEPKTYNISSATNEWQAFDITVKEDIVISKSLQAPVTIGASLTALKKFWNHEYTITDTTPTIILNITSNEQK